MENDIEMHNQPIHVDIDVEDVKPEIQELEESTAGPPTSEEEADVFKLVFRKTFDGSMKPTLVKLEPSSRPPTPIVSGCCFATDEGCVQLEKIASGRGSSVDVEVGSSSSSSGLQGDSSETGSSAVSTPEKAPLSSGIPNSPKSSASKESVETSYKSSAENESDTNSTERYDELRRKATKEAMPIHTPECYDSEASPTKKPRGKIVPLYKRRIQQSKKANLTFPVGRIHRLLKASNCNQRISKEGAVYTAAVMEYMTAELLETSGNCAREAGKKRIAPRDLLLAVAHDADMDEYFRRENVMLTGAGVVPSTREFLQQQGFPKDLLDKLQSKARARAATNKEKKNKKPKKDHQ